MSKLYISYIPKAQGDSRDFKLIQSLEKCMHYYSGENNIISSPGYLSRTANVTDFVDEFKKIVPQKEKIYIGYLKGMNKITGTPGLCTRIEEHYDELLKTGLFRRLNIKIANKSDHRKMLFIFGIKENPQFDFKKDKLNNATKGTFLDSIIVNAVLIGSSNQSYTTYFGGSAGKADKGEADVLLFATDNGKTVAESMHVEGTVIFEEILGVGMADAHEYLKDILREFLSKALDD